MAIGAKVTLRGERMYEFLDRLITTALPRVRDFQGVKANGFDGRGNYNLGVTEQSSSLKSTSIKSIRLQVWILPSLLQLTLIKKLNHY